MIIRNTTDYTSIYTDHSIHSFRYRIRVIIVQLYKSMAYPGFFLGGIDQ